MFVNHMLRARGDDSLAPSPTLVKLLVALVVLLVVSLVLVGALYLLRHVRKSKKAAELPMYHEKQRSTAPQIRSSFIHVSQEKQALFDEECSPPQSPIPEIRITFPEELDDSGKRKSGRVVVVRVGDRSVGLEPLHEDLPSYQNASSDRFQSLDLERIGGLKENTR